MSGRRLITPAPRRGVHKSTGGILPTVPLPVDPVGAAPPLDFEHSRSPQRKMWEVKNAKTNPLDALDQ